MLDLFPRGSLLVVGIGGGGDVVSAALFARILRKSNRKTYIASIVWERYINDPVPGPIPFDNIHGFKRIGEYTAIVTGETYAERMGRKIFFEAAKVSGVINEEVYIVDLWHGVRGYVRGLEELIEYLGVDWIVGIDVGGDVLAEGSEQELWSPLADSMGLAALSKVGDSSIMIYSPGADGELRQEHVLMRISRIMEEGGYIGAIGVPKEYLGLYEKLLDNTLSEASRIGLLALKGFYGRRKIRGGTREIIVSPLSTIAFILSASKAFEHSRPAKLVRDTGDLEEAWKRLVSNNIPTEYDLERAIYRYCINTNKKPNELTPNEILEIKGRVWSEIRG